MNQISMPISISSFSHRLAGVFTLLLGAALSAQTTPKSSTAMPEVVVFSTHVANQTPVASFATPVSALRFEPRIDVQSRNLAEGQADVSIRGGVFENTGFRIGAISLYDPQTGHYLAEVPVPPAMLVSPSLLTGAENALLGFNAGVGTVDYGWRRIEPRGELSVAAGDYSFNRQSLYQGAVLPGQWAGRTLAADVEWARSSSDGALAFGDHKFQRVGGRLQLRGESGQTDFFAGYQAKFFGWPNLYTPFNSNETEKLQTVLFTLNHREQLPADRYWQVGLFYRRNKDDYAFNRFAPVGAIHPFQHTTYTRGLASDGRLALGGLTVAYSAQAMDDFLRSTSLIFGKFHTRRYAKAAVVPELAFASAAGKVTARAGAAFDTTNRDSSAFSPIAGVDLQRSPTERYYLQYAESTQVPTYTALNSNAAAGLFRGNPNLGRETSRNLEAGLALRQAGWDLKAAVFYRWDDRLVDWTFRRGVTARTANAVDIGTAGVELVASRKTRRCDVVVGYTYLDKCPNYGPATIDASFYALNFAKHRLTAALTLRLGAGFEARLDNEFRVQEKNSLRSVGGNESTLTSVGLYYLPPTLRGLELAFLVENLWDSRFQEVPAVPATPRQFSAGVTWRY